MYQDVILGFENYLHNVKKASANTVVSYKRDLKKFCNFLKNNGVYNCGDIRNDDVEAYVNFLRKKGFSDSTVSRSIATIKAFNLYLTNEGRVLDSINIEVKAPKVIKKTPGILSIEEIDCLLSQPSSNRPKHLRDKAMLELMYATGIRVTELITLKVSDVNLKGAYIICKEDNSQRVIPFGTEAKKALNAYMTNGRPALVTDSNMHLLFTNCSGGEMSRQGFWKLIKSYAVKAKIESEITPHTLRHSFAAHLIENGADVHTVSEMLGHSDISSTKVYVNMNNNRIRKVYERSHPRK